MNDGPDERCVLVPVKSFRAAKLRLAAVLDAEAREALARELASVVLEAAAPLSVLVVCDDEDVAAWALARGARVAWTPGLGLSAAVTAGVAQLASEGVALAVVAHADLPFAAGLASLGGRGKVTLVPDRRPRRYQRGRRAHDLWVLFRLRCRELRAPPPRGGQAGAGVRDRLRP